MFRGFILIQSKQHGAALWGDAIGQHCEVLICSVAMEQCHWRHFVAEPWDGALGQHYGAALWRGTMEWHCWETLWDSATGQCYGVMLWGNTVEAALWVTLWDSAMKQS